MTFSFVGFRTEAAGERTLIQMNSPFVLFQVLPVTETETAPIASHRLIFPVCGRRVQRGNSVWSDFIEQHQFVTVHWGLTSDFWERFFNTYRSDMLGGSPGRLVRCFRSDRRAIQAFRTAQIHRWNSRARLQLLDHDSAEHRQCEVARLPGIHRFQLFFRCLHVNLTIQSAEAIWQEQTFSQRRDSTTVYGEHKLAQIIQVGRSSFWWNAEGPKSKFPYPGVSSRVQSLKRVQCPGTDLSRW